MARCLRKWQKRVQTFSPLMPLQPYRLRQYTTEYQMYIKRVNVVVAQLLCIFMRIVVANLIAASDILMLAKTLMIDTVLMFYPLCLYIYHFCYVRLLQVAKTCTTHFMHNLFFCPLRQTSILENHPPSFTPVKST